MQIIVDNGGTKSDWGIVETNHIFSTDSINLFDSELNATVNTSSECGLILNN